MAAGSCAPSVCTVTTDMSVIRPVSITVAPVAKFVYTAEEIRTLQEELLNRLEKYDFKGELAKHNHDLVWKYYCLGKGLASKDIDVKKSNIRDYVEKYNIVDFDFRKVCDLKIYTFREENFFIKSHLFSMTYIDIGGNCYSSCFCFDPISLSHTVGGWHKRSTTWNEILFHHPFWGVWEPYEIREHMPISTIRRIKSRPDFVVKVNTLIDKKYRRKPDNWFVGLLKSVFETSKCMTITKTEPHEFVGETGFQYLTGNYDGPCDCISISEAYPACDIGDV